MPKPSLKVGAARVSQSEPSNNKAHATERRHRAQQAAKFAGGRQQVEGINGTTEQEDTTKQCIAGKLGRTCERNKCRSNEYSHRVHHVVLVRRHICRVF